MRRTPRPLLAVTALTGLLAVAGCSGDGAGLPGRELPGASSGAESPGAGRPSGATATEPPAAPAKGSVKVVRTLTAKLASPWGLAALPGGDLLVGSRDTGKIVRVSAKDGGQREVGTVPGVAAAGEGGLLGLAVSPDYGTDHLVYAYFTTDSDNRIARMRYDDTKPAAQRLGAPGTVFRGIPKGTVHNGGRIAFGPDRMLYAGTGESGEKGLAQKPESFGGKILRMTPDGRPAPRNPRVDSVVYSSGHRNVQGLAWDADKRLWASEFGQDTWDELNLVEPGGNYGWPTVEGKAGKAGFKDPVEQWRTADASPSGLACAKGSLWMAGLRGERLWRIPLRGAKPVAEPQAFLKGEYGRLRTVVATDDGGLWLTTSNTDGRGRPGGEDDRILRLEVS
ncbi:glucose sorbosone dehydrogenase [Streptomyces eurocidicus]|uniref:Glucose sorbosone dehydrogenase n=1 Tax=Streptomyces eurocidicus TaxID=66423 RepID=A0A2N8NP11_STREU|nr:PQQ-dependent sugar dehydrogenase [Streptomyces eurocidicus]MBB5116808.1 glucose/arabinose dehydrogenase [Streptomyces eurocidicus]MBF6052191.1 PQQ-dependent sugar dehydrogenase [Streptomyces eurocidicus]PNE30505.1 glucose sorbosone dehydrogenase [Streptomyces eurocidicus]